MGDSSQFAKYFNSASDSAAFSAAEVRPITPSTDGLSLPQTSDGGSGRLPSRLREGQSSISTGQPHSEAAGSCKRVRVAVEGSSVCLYRTISVTGSDRAGGVVREAMKKHGIEGDPAHYHLQLTDHLNQRKPL